MTRLTSNYRLSIWPVAVALVLLTVCATPSFAANGDAAGADPTWSSLLPPILAILLALAFRQVIPALLAGIWVGASLAHGGPMIGLRKMLDTYLIGALADSDHMKIVIFSMLLGGMVGVISRSGGTTGLIESLSSYATDSRRGQLVSWFLGLLIFFDDYANTLLVGNTMRPVTDRLKISREKLAYIVDSTAAPVASIFLVSTWIGYEVSLIASGLEGAGIAREAYSVFIQSLPYNFYPILAIFFVGLVAWRERDFGPMLKAERRALAGQVLRKGAKPLSELDDETFNPKPGKAHRWYNALIPIIVVLVVSFLTLWMTGRQGLIDAGDPRGTAGIFSLGIEGLGAVLEQSASYDALLYGAFAGCVVALMMAFSQRILSIAEGLESWSGGIKSMTPAIIILMLAWAIGDVCKSLHTADYLSAWIGDSSLPAALLPTLIFALSAFTAFSTGSSWTTMAIVIPISISTVSQITGGSNEGLLLGSVSAVLAGAIFGDHCSPISDTTVMSSMASGCDHVDHVRTQLPYALTVAIVSILIGYIPAGLGVPPLLCLIVSAAVLVAITQFVGKPRAAG